MKSFLNRKISKILWTIGYCLLVVAFCISGGLIFHSTYYLSIFVSGDSMYPTLLGGKTGSKDNIANFGIVDTTDIAKSKIKRFDIVTTYYPWTYTDYGPNSFNSIPSPEEFMNYDLTKHLPSASYKIKRVIAFSGETISFSQNGPHAWDLIITTNEDKNLDGIKDVLIYGDVDLKNPLDVERAKNLNIIPLPFKRYCSNGWNPGDNIEKKYGRDSLTFTVPEKDVYGQPCYFVMGDNWRHTQSDDCALEKMPIWYDNLVGVLAAIEGTCKISSNGLKCDSRKYFIPKVY